MAESDSPIQFNNFRPQKRPAGSTAAGRTRERKHGDLLRALTIKLVDTYSHSSVDFNYTLQLAPRRVLTKLSKGVHNQGYDNSEHDYICRVCDQIVNPDGVTYEILERLGQGTFGQVLKCVVPRSSRTGAENSDSFDNPIALKIIKNKPAYFHQALVEVHILKLLNEKCDPDDDKRIVRMLDFFVYRKHLCIAFELLSVNLYDVLKQNSFRGVSMALIRVLTEQLLKAMQCLRDAFVIHCDLKPENVLLSNMQHTRIKLIDFGSACFENHTVYSYIQSRFYRSPEVLLGLPYTTAIDMWSLGCICSELFLGLPIFPGHSEYDQVCRIVEVQGLPPPHMLDLGKNTRKYFRRVEEPQPADSGDGDLASGSSDCGSYDPLDGVESVNSDDERLLPSPNGQAAPDEEPIAALPTAEVPDLAPPAAEVASSLDEENTLQAGSSTSLLDLFKQKVGFSTEPPPPLPTDQSEEENSAAKEAGMAPSSSGSAGGGTGVSESEACSILAGSNVSTAADTNDALQRRLFASGAAGVSASDVSAGTAGTSGAQRRGPSGDEAEDGRGEARVSGSSEGCFAPAAMAEGPGQRLPFRPRTRRRRVRTFWRLKTREEYERDEHKKEPTPKKYFDFKSLEQMVERLPWKNNMSSRAKAEEQERRECFLQFLWGVLHPNPDERWTPKQAAGNPFISGLPFAPNFVPVEDRPVPSFTITLQAARSSTIDVATGRSGVGEVPRLPAEALGQGQAGAFSGGGSARTWQENSAGMFRSSEDAEGQPRSAPSTFRGARGPPASGALVPPDGAPAQGGTEKTLLSVPNVNLPFPNNVTLSTTNAPEVILPDVQPDGMRGLWGHLCAGVPLPDDNPAESYRPPIEQISEDFFRGRDRSSVLAATAATARRRQGGEQAKGNPQQPHGGAWVGSTGAAFCSSATSTGSTPTHGHGRGRRNPTGSPFSVGSSISTSGSYRKSHPNSTAQQEPPKCPQGRHQGTGPALSYGVPPHGNVSPNSVVPLTASGPTSGTPQGGVPHTAPGARPGPCTSRGSRGGSAAGGSRGSSPWHLPSPMSELSIASESLGGVHSSQPSGSDSCGENMMPHEGGAQWSFDEQSSEDPSHSDGHWPRGHQPSDSDGTMTPQSHDAVGHNRAEEERGAGKDPRDALWENIKSEMQRVELSRDRLPRRHDVTQSPGSAPGAMGNFREKMGMNESGPVIPFGHGARRDGNAASSGAPGYGVFTPPGNQHQVMGYNDLGSSQSGTTGHGGGGHGHHGHGRRRLKNKPHAAATGHVGSGSGTPGSGAL